MDTTDSVLEDIRLLIKKKNCSECDIKRLIHCTEYEKYDLAFTKLILIEKKFLGDWHFIEIMSHTRNRFLTMMYFAIVFGITEDDLKEGIELSHGETYLERVVKPEVLEAKLNFHNENALRLSFGRFHFDFYNLKEFGRKFISEESVCTFGLILLAQSGIVIGNFPTIKSADVVFNSFNFTSYTQERYRNIIKLLQRLNVIKNEEILFEIELALF